MSGNLRLDTKVLIVDDREANLRLFGPAQTGLTPALAPCRRRGRAIAGTDYGYRAIILFERSFDTQVTGALTTIYPE